MSAVLHTAPAVARRSPPHPSSAVLAELPRPRETFPQPWLDDLAQPVSIEVCILERCAAEIANEIGPAATLIDFSAGSQRPAAIVFAALDTPAARVRADLARIDNLATRDASGRQLLFFPGAQASHFTPENAVMQLQRIAAAVRRDALLVIGADATSDFGFARLQAYAARAGWAHCQFWSDGCARFGVHVLERADSSERFSTGAFICERNVSFR